MTKPCIVCIDDQREVLAALERDLIVFKDHFTVIECETADEGEEVLAEIDAEGEAAAVIICDHVMPEKNGVDFLIEVNNDPRFRHTRKVLLTGLATHQDTITAINQAHINHYIEKPWEAEHLVAIIKAQITGYILETGLDYREFLPVLDQEVLYSTMHASPGV